MSRDATDPAHYKHGAVECWEFAGSMGFLLGSAAKYLYRAGHKGDPREDIGKAQKFIAREMAVRARGDGTFTRPGQDAQAAFDAWRESEGFSLRAEIMYVLWLCNQGSYDDKAGWSLLDALNACEEFKEEFET